MPHKSMYLQVLEFLCLVVATFCVGKYANDSHQMESMVLPAKAWRMPSFIREAAKDSVPLANASVAPQWQLVSSKDFACECCINQSLRRAPTLLTE
jgi:hypothetical protein